MDDLEFKTKLEELIGKSIINLNLQGKGACNNAYFVETTDGSKYIVKKERIDKETSEQNSLAVEANVLKKLNKCKITTPLPEIIFCSDIPSMYGYTYIEGVELKTLWAGMSHEEKINICNRLGLFHAEIGKKFSKETAFLVGVKIDDSKDQHPETLVELKTILSDELVPSEFKELAIKAKDIFDSTAQEAVFHFIHNDAHHRNILIKDGEISGIIDFGDAEYGETAKEFSRYIRDFPYHFQYIVSSYSKHSGNKLSFKRLVSNSYLSGLVDIVDNYKKGGDARVKSKEDLRRYVEIINS